MSNATFTYLEEYIEFIGGYIDIHGKQLGFFNLSCPISLARYDVSVIDSFSYQTSLSGIAYTDKQLDLAMRIVDKYRRQLFNLNPGVVVPENVQGIPLRLGVRHIDRTKSVMITDDQFVLKFPFDTGFIDKIKKLGRESNNGAITFDPANKQWKFGMTEYLLNWIMSVCPQNGFDVSTEVQQLYQELLKVESQGYQIELDIKNGEPEISHAPSSLLEYVNDALGGLHLGNLLALVDYSAVLGYTVSSAVLEVVKLQHPKLYKMITKRKLNIKRYDGFMNDIVEYAEITGRLPIYIYDTGVPQENTDKIIYLNRNVSPDVKPKLMVSMTSMMIGNKKANWLNNSEKIFVIE